MLRRILGSLFGGLIAGCYQSESLPISEVGTWGDVETYVERLVAADGHAILVIEVMDSEKFIQFSADSGVVQMDFPLVTPEQQAREERIRGFFAQRELSLVENIRTDGSRFLDCDLAAGPDVIARLTHEVLREIFDVSEDVQLRFLGENLAAAP
jgi:hypothetical protein